MCVCVKPPHEFKKQPTHPLLLKISYVNVSVYVSLFHRLASHQSLILSIRLHCLYVFPFGGEFSQNFAQFTHTHTHEEGGISITLLLGGGKSGWFHC